MSLTSRVVTRRRILAVALAGVTTITAGAFGARVADAFGILEPVATVTATPVSGEAPLVVAFDGSASSGPNPIVDWAWDFGDGATGTGATVSHTYTAPGTFVATLVVTDNFALTSFPRPVTITVTPTTKPAAPTGLAVTSRTRTSISLGWTNPGTNQTSIVVERCKGATCTGFRPVATLTGTATSYTNTGLTRNTAYRYRVRAVNTAGTAVSTAIVARTAR